MTDDVSNLILEHLRHLRAGQDALRADMLEVKERLGQLEAGYASLSRRIDRMDGRLVRIETRLGLIDPALPGT